MKTGEEPISLEWKFQALAPNSRLLPDASGRRVSRVVKFFDL